MRGGEQLSNDETQCAEEVQETATATAGEDAGETTESAEE
jgi:hypothetical protein